MSAMILAPFEALIIPMNSSVQFVWQFVDGTVRLCADYSSEERSQQVLEAFKQEIKRRRAAKLPCAGEFRARRPDEAIEDAKNG